MPDIEELEQAIEQCQEGNPVPWMKLLLKVEDKSNRLVPFRLGAVTQKAADSLWKRTVVLKARQTWVTTFFEAVAYAFVSCIPGFKVGIILHEDGAGERAFKRIKLFHESVDHALRPELSYDRKDMIEIASTKSAIYIGTARGNDFARSGTFNMLILSEFANYSGEDAEKIMDSAIDTVPPDGWVIIESTPQGLGNKFHTLYTSAVEGTSTWRALCLPWFMHEEYAFPEEHPFVQPEDKGEFTPDPRELELMLQNGLSRDQIRWRRWKLRELRASGDEHLFAQNFPEDDVSCWLASQDAAFPEEPLKRMWDEKKAPLWHEGHVSKWKMPYPGTRYVMFVDTAEGVPGGDDQYACVLSCVSGEQVSKIHGNMTQDTFARICDGLGREYYNCLIVPERNQAALFIDVLVRLGYPDIYRHGDGVDARLGFPTTPVTKPKMVAAMIGALQSGEFRTYDEATIRQMMEYRKLKDKSGLHFVYSAPTGRHDDAVMGCMGANLMRLTMPQHQLHKRPRQVSYYRMENETW